MSDYSDVIEAVATEYGPKAMALLGSIRGLLMNEGLIVTEPFDMSDDVYRWSMVVHDAQGNSKVDLTVEIAEERDYDDADGFGVNFGLDITCVEGRVLGGLQPFNYTPEVWVDSRDKEAVEQRWLILANAEMAEDIPDLVKQGM